MCHNSTNNCGCHKDPCSLPPGAPLAANFSQFMQSVNAAATATAHLTAAVRLMVPARLFHAVRDHVTVSPDVPKYRAGDVLSRRPVSDIASVWTNNRTDTVIDAPPAIDVVPLEGGSKRVFTTVPATASPYNVTCPDGGFTSVSVTCGADMHVAATPEDVDVITTRVVHPAGSPFQLTRTAGEPRISPFCVRPVTAATLYIVYSA